MVIRDREYGTSRNLTLDELTTFNEGALAFVSIEGFDTKTGRPYSFDFIPEHVLGPYIRIQTKPRKDFLKQGTEQEAQDALIDVAARVRASSGGFFDIHPFFGAVWETKITPVAPGFSEGMTGLDDELMMLIHLSDNGKRFNSALTDDFQELDSGSELVEYLESLSGENPNQKNRDQAIANELQEPWEDQFRRFNKHNSEGNVIAFHRAMYPSPHAIVALMESLRSDGVVNIQVAQVNYHYPSSAT